MQRFGNDQFNKFSSFIYSNFGIHMNESKKEILHTKLNKLISRYNLASYDEYYGNLLNSTGGKLLTEFADEITVNKTSFFRENNHFLFIKDNIARLIENNPRIMANNEIRVWSSACSTGEEAYSLAITLKECVPGGMNIRLLATDISCKALTVAQKGIYPHFIKDDVEYGYLARYFEKTAEGYAVSESVKKLVTFRFFNLMDAFPFKNSFDMVFCRNVMIYFDSAVRGNLLDRFHKVLSPGGLLFVGHSESIAGQTHRFKYLQPTVYLKC